jgi:hypothetical protein
VRGAIRMLAPRKKEEPKKKTVQLTLSDLARKPTAAAVSAPVSARFSCLFRFAPCAV